MTPIRSALGLRLIWFDGAQVTTLLGVQGANVAGEEARQVLNEIDFNTNLHGTYSMAQISFATSSFSVRSLPLLINL